MSRRSRAALVVGALVVVVAAFVALRPADDKPAAHTDTKTTPTGPRQVAKPPTTRPAAHALSPGAAPTVTVSKGDRVRLVVRSPKADEAHVHGYDLLKPVSAGGTARFDFRARFDGVFEIELEKSGEKVGSLEVRP